MLNNMQKTVCALAVLASTALPALAESIDVKVIGTIEPTACTPNLSGGGTVDYGTIQPNTLNRDAFNVLDTKTVDFSITCDAPAKVGVTAKSARGVSAVNNDGSLSEVSVLTNPLSSVAYGLGLDGTTGIGGYILQIQTNTVSLDSKSASTIQKNNITDTAWASTTAGTMAHVGQARVLTWAEPSTLTPKAFTTMAGKLSVQAYINKASELDLTKPVKLDGLSTIELVYL